MGLEVQETPESMCRYFSKANVQGAHRGSEEPGALCPSPASSGPLGPLARANVQRPEHLVMLWTVANPSQHCLYSYNAELLDTTKSKGRLDRG